MKGGLGILLLTGAFLVTALYGLWGNGLWPAVSLFVSLVLGLACVIGGCWLVFSNRRPFVWRIVFASLVPFMAVAFMFLRGDEALVDLFRGRVVFRGTCEHTVTFVHLVLREDGSCAFEPGSFLDRNWQNGEWTRTGDRLHVQLGSGRKVPAVTMDLLITPDALEVVSSDTVAHAHLFLGSTAAIPSAHSNGL